MKASSVATKKKDVKRFSVTKKAVAVTCTAMAFALAVPTGVFAYESVQFKSQKKELNTQLQEQVKDDVATYVKGSVIKDTYFSNNTVTTGSSSDVITGFVTKGSATTSTISYDELADEISKILTDDYINKMESDMLTDVYSRIDTIVATKLESASSYSDEDIQKISEAVKSIVTVDLTNYKQELLLKYDELNNLYSKLNERINISETNYTNLSNDVALLKTTYDTKFALLEATDTNLQAQITLLKAQNTAINNQYNTLQSNLALQKKDMEGIRSELQTRIDELNTSSAKGDVELKNLLLSVQDELDSTMGIEDAKIYDNAVAIIELTDKLTNMNTDFSAAIEVLNNQTGEDTAELYATLLALQSSLQTSDSTFSTAVNTEREQRLIAVNELITLIESLKNDTTTTDSDIYLTIERKSRNLASELDKTSSDMKAEYTALITDTNTNLNDRITVVNAQLENSIQATDEKLTTNLNATESKLTASIQATDEKLTTNLNSTESKLTASIQATDEKLTTNLNSTESKLTASIDDTKTNLTTYINTENLRTREEMAAAIEILQDEIIDLQGQINELQKNKLNIVDSTVYNYSTSDGNTITITVPSTNPNYRYAGSPYTNTYDDENTDPATGE